MHTWHPVAPVTFWNVPPSQSSQVELPSISANEPTLQGKQFAIVVPPGFGLWVLRVHLSAVRLVELAGQKCPGMQGPLHVGALRPGVVPAVPAGHGSGGESWPRTP